MRYLKTLLVSLLALVGTSAFAQTWTGSEAAAGTYYLYNVGTGKWLCGGNNWGTHASVGDYGIDFILAGSNGAYTLDSQLSNGGNSHFLNGEWCDGASMSWTFTQVKTEDGAIAYTIGNGQQFLTANTSDTNVNLKGNEGALSQWILVSKADIAQAALDAKATDVVDVTGFIIGQRTSRNNTRAQVTGDRQLNSNNNVWKMERDADGRWCQFAMDSQGGTGSAATPYAIEAWNWKSFNFYQDIAGVPNGKYTLHVNSFYRGYDGIRGYVYANDAMSPLTAETDAYRSYGAPSDLRNAAAAFFDGKYDNTVDVTVTDGNIRVGVKQMDAPGGDWMPFANFRLEYKGMASMLKSSIDKANELIPTLDEQNAAGLQEAVDAAQAVYDNPDATNAEIQEAIEALEDAYKTFNAVNEAKQLAYDVLTQVPAALYPDDFDWDAPRDYKVYKNNEGKYQLAARGAVAALIEIADMLADPSKSEGIDMTELATLATAYARLVVETHGVGYALGEQGDVDYALMNDEYDGLADLYEYYNWYINLLYGRFYGIDIANPDAVAHILDPNLADGGADWTIDGWNVLSGESLTDAESTVGNGTDYPYFDNWSATGFSANAYQELDLPAGRYMLTAAGRASQNVYDEIGAQDPDHYFQLYVVDGQGKVTYQTFEQIGNKDGIYGYGWNDASVFFTLDAAAKVKVGVRAQSDKEGWASATRFRLTHLGDATVYLNENETFGKEYNWDAWTWMMEMCPSEFLLHKEMQAGKWYSIALPGDISWDQLCAQFGDDVELAQPVGVIDLSEDNPNKKVVTFVKWKPYEMYALGGIATDLLFGDYIDGTMANVPYLIKPAQVKPSNRYLFKNIISTDTHSFDWESGKGWSWGAISVSDDPEEFGYIWFGDSGNLKFYPNYTFEPKFPEAYTIEFADTLKAFTGTMVATGDTEIAGVALMEFTDDGVAFGDDYLDIFMQQLDEAEALGKQKAEWYPGIPAAMTKAMTTMGRIRTIDDAANALEAIKSAIVEAKKAYEPSKQFNALMAQANDLLATEHSELVEGADDAFKSKIEDLQKRFDALTVAAPIADLIDELTAAIAEYKEQIFVAGTIDDGNYYIMNVGTGKYLNGGNSWGTRASLTDNREYFTTAKLEDGAYTLESRFSNGGEQYYLGPNYYVDNGNPMHLTITAVSEKAFTISCTGESGFGYLGWDGSESTEVRVLADADSENAQWVFVSVDDVIADIPNATVEEPKDATPLIKDAYFGRNHRDVAAWEGDGFSTNSSGNTVAEKWGGNSQTFDIHQTVTVPDGVYRLSFYGYYRYNNTEENTTQVAIDSHKDGTEVLNSFVYANDVEVALKSIADDKAVEVLGESNLPFSMDAAGQAFAQGLYKHEILVKVEGGKLVLGIKKINHPGCDWTVWDDFILTYYGDTTIEDVQKAYPAETGATTGINEVNTSVNTGAIYNLNGVRVNNMTKKGVYIVNGKKIVVK